MEGDERWWHGAVLYQVYVRSWRDTDGDGFGDLAGVIEGLDYLTAIGVDGVWLSPTMPSPNEDWGYDVSNYFGVHGDLGTLDTLDELIAEADRRGLRVLLDLVPNHSSSSHPWFVESRSSKTSPFREFYVWADPSDDGGAPNNWRDFMGEPAWTFDQGTGQYYLHKFLPSQPDLNWWNPDVRTAFEDVLRFWLDRGVAGFRIDVAEGLYHDDQLRDDPPASAGDPRAEGGLLREFSGNRPEVHQVYRDWRQHAERYSPPRLLLGETWMVPVEELGDYYGDDDELQLAFNFPFLCCAFSAPELKSVVAATMKQLPPWACPVWAASNHDLGRFPTRWCGGNEAKIRLALTVLLTLPGATMLYYGDEIGMTDVDVPVSAQMDPMTTDGRGDTPNRDRARTPMQWSGDENGGFAPAGSTPWLPLGDCGTRNVASQQRDGASTLSLVSELIRTRRTYMRGQIVPYEELPSGPDQWLYRSGPLLVAANLSDQPAETALSPRSLVVLRSEPRDGPIGPRHSALAPWEAAVFVDAPDSIDSPR